MGRIKNDQSSSKGSKIQGAQAKDPNPEQAPPTFCLRHMRKGFDLTECNNEEKAAVADTLFKLSQMTWAQIRLSPRHGAGSEKIAQSSITGDSTAFLDKDTELLALRFSGKKAMVGYRGKDGTVFHILWLDRAFNLYGH